MESKIKEGDKVLKKTKLLSGWQGTVLLLRHQNNRDECYVHWQYDKLGNPIKILNWLGTEYVEPINEFL